MKKSTYRVCGMVLAMAVALGSAPVTTGIAKVKNENASKAVVADAVSGSPVVVSGPTALDKTDVNTMAGKKITLTLKNITGGSAQAYAVSFTSDNEAVAKPSTNTVAADFTSVTCTIDLLAKGSAVITANAGGSKYTCNVNVVPAFSKADFSMYRPSNFVTAYKKVSKKYAWYYDGEWGKPAKYGSTYRGIRIGKTISDVTREYGELTLKKCNRKKDAFLYEKQFNSGKKLKVSKYTEFVYKDGKITYRLRIYFTSAGKVHGFIYLAGKSFEKISKDDYRKGKRTGESLI